MALFYCPQTKDMEILNMCMLHIILRIGNLVVRKAGPMEVEETVIVFAEDLDSYKMKLLEE